MDALSDARTGPRSSEAASDAADRHIHGEGTPERLWRAWDGLQACPAISIDMLVPARSRLVVVSPHPDDEVLGCGGAMSLLARAGRRVTVVGVTDGEASHAGSIKWTPRLLADRRQQERLAGLARLGVATPPLALGIADGGVTPAEATLAATLLELVRADDVLVTPWRFDGHPDHEATGRAVARVAALSGARCWEMPIWMWHWARPGDPLVPWHRLRRLNLDAEASQCKRSAIAAHASQLEPVPGEQRAAVLPHWALARALRPFEMFFDTEAAA